MTFENFEATRLKSVACVATYVVFHPHELDNPDKTYSSKVKSGILMHKNGKATRLTSLLDSDNVDSLAYTKGDTLKLILEDISSGEASEAMCSEGDLQEAFREDILGLHDPEEPNITFDPSRFEGHINKTSIWATRFIHLYPTSKSKLTPIVQTHLRNNETEQLFCTKLASGKSFYQLKKPKRQ